jgi:tRNA A37 threonylcarbamoyladenosine dehydratase
MFPPMPLPMATSAAGPGSVQHRTERRFDRAGRLFTEAGLHRLLGARVVVFGMGGVGSFAAEALVRSGIGHLTIVDFDLVCVTNTNRQLHAMKGTIGKKKVDVLAERFARISPSARIEAVPVFYNADSSDELLGGPFDYVVDAIDNMTAKAHLVASCIRRGLPIVSSMGAAARMDPTQIRVADLAQTSIDPFARALRKILRSVHGIECSAEHPAGVQAVYSLEPPLDPAPLSYDEGEGFQCVCPQVQNDLHSCDRRRRIDGSAAFVTGSFGFATASVVVRELTRQGPP